MKIEDSLFNVNSANDILFVAEKCNSRYVLCIKNGHRFVIYVVILH